MRICWLKAAAVREAAGEELLSEACEELLLSCWYSIARNYELVMQGEANKGCFWSWCEELLLRSCCCAAVGGKLL